MARRRLPNSWPSPEARARILALFRALESHPETTVYAHRAISISRRDDCPFTYATLRHYLRHMVAMGDLVRVASGIYRLPFSSLDEA